MNGFNLSNQYWLFGTENYYPSGGMHDLRGTFNNQYEFEEYFENEKHNLCDNYHIVNTSEDAALDIIYFSVFYDDWNGSINLRFRYKQIASDITFEKMFRMLTIGDNI